MKAKMQNAASNVPSSKLRDCASITSASMFVRRPFAARARTSSTILGEKIHGCNALHARSGQKRQRPRAAREIKDVRRCIWMNDSKPLFRVPRKEGGDVLCVRVRDGIPNAGTPSIIG